MLQQFNTTMLATMFALLASIVSLITWSAITVLEFRKTGGKTDYRFVAFDLLGVFLMAWFAAGYIVILTGSDVNTANLFRPVFPVLLISFTGLGVILYKNATATDELTTTKERLTQLLERCEGVREIEEELKRATEMVVADDG